jgi:3-oxoacyl-[acyl-carrier protein] reductase
MPMAMTRGATRLLASRGSASTSLAELGCRYGRALAVEADLSDPATPAGLFDLAEERLGPVDVLVNNATGLGSRHLHPGRD